MSSAKEVEGEATKAVLAYQGTVSSQNQHPQVHSSGNKGAHPTQYQQHGLSSGHAHANQLDAGQNQSPASHTPFDMKSMTGALPPQAYPMSFPTNTQDHQHHHLQHDGSSAQRHPGGPTPPNNFMYNNPGPHLAHYATQSNMHGQPFYMQPQGPVPPFFGHPHMSGTHNSPGQLPGAPSRQHAPYYHGSAIMSQHTAPGYYYQPQIHAYPSPTYTLPGLSSGIPHGRLRNGESQHIFGGAPVQQLGNTSASVVRGPPRKPRQSGHAIWIGNLPPQTDLMSLVRHVCTETPGLESLFLISKSNCAFANFKDEEKCVTAQQKLHDSKFQSVRLVSRLRKSTVEGVAGQTAPTGPSSISPAVQPVIGGRELDAVRSSATPSDNLSENEGNGTLQELGPDQAHQTIDGGPRRDRFFVLKSLTVEDLELSVRNGVWATQSHNEENLNKAFETSANVYLVFSANKSGEYFGYARMTSPINDDPAAAIQFAPKVQPTSQVDLPKSIPTESTEGCPRGRIIDDSSRGTIFWEVDRDEEEEPASDAKSDISSSMNEPSDVDGESKAWGKPFNLEWQSITRLPFYRTRGLRNVWNSNRDVKIARDGTELETSVGKKLIGLFNRPHIPAPQMSNMACRPGMMPPPTGYPQPPPPPTSSFR